MYANNKIFKFERFLRILLLIESTGIKPSMTFYNLFSFQFIDVEHKLGKDSPTSAGAIVTYCFIAIIFLGVFIVFLCVYCKN